MNILTIDFETYYDTAYSLSKMTTEEYLRDELFEAIGVAVKVNDGDTQWFSGTQRDMQKWLAQFDWENSVALAHNAMFDMAILNWHFGIRPKRIADTLSMARALHGTEVGGSLKAMAEFYQLGAKGTEVLNAQGKGRLDFTKEQLDRYGEYCINDVNLTYDLFNAMLPMFPLVELKLVDLTIRMFTEPVLQLDTPTLTEHLRKVQDKKAALMAAVENSRADLMSNPKMAVILTELGVDPPTKVSPATGKETWAFGKTDEGFKALLEHEDPRVQALVAARLGVKSTLEETRTERFLDIAKRGSLPVPLRYYAAHTGRWGGDDKVNLQNLPRKSALKKAIRAPEGYVFIDCDSSQIEARTLAWLAGQQDLVEFFQKNNEEIAAGVPKEEMQFDPYKIMASDIYGVLVDKVSEDQRFVGKTTILGCFGPDTKVLTNHGWKPIVEVQAMDTLWDGEEWVTHQGVVPQGIKEVLVAQGLTATPDHEILTEHGWQEWSEVATNPSLFQSAIDRVNWKSSVGNNTINQLAVRLDGTQLSAVIAVGKDAWTATISKPGAQLDVMSAQKVHQQPHVRNTGVTKILSRTSNIVNAFSTALLAVSDAVTIPKLKPTLITGVGAFSYTNRGAMTEARSYATLFLLMAGKTQNETSTVSTTVRGMSRIISVLRRAGKTPATSVQSAPCRRRLMTYDIAYAGPRNRYTVATDAGPIIVHNCGYGMGAPKFQAQLKAFGVDMDIEECKRIIRVYRERYPMIPELWEQGGRAIKAMIGHSTSPFGRDGVVAVNMLGIRLPNGLYLKYPNLRCFEDVEMNRLQYAYDQKRGRATLETRIYGGKLVENVCQALARIIIGEQMLMIARRLRVVMTVHDAVGSIAPTQEAEEARTYVEDCMRIQPKWAAGLPLNCESKMGVSYGG